MRWRTAVTDDPDDKTRGRFGPISRGRHLVSPPNWPTKDVMLVIEEMGYAPDLHAAVRSALGAVMAGGEGWGGGGVPRAVFPGARQADGKTMWGVVEGE